MAISPRAEYAVVETTGAPSGMANATMRTPHTVAGCRVSVLPFPSWTLTEETSARSLPNCTWVGPHASPLNSTGSVLFQPAVGTDVLTEPDASAGPVARKICWPRPAPPAPGRPATICQRWPLTVPDAISPGVECGPGGRTVAL